MTIKDIARLSGYAVGTVSRVLNHQPNVSDEAREKIMAVVEANHFRLNNNAKHLKQQTNTGIAIVVKGTHNMLFATIVERIQARIKDHGYASLIYYIDEDDDELEQALQATQDRRPYGIVFLGSNLDYFQECFFSITVPCVLVSNSAAALGAENLSSVSTDDEQAAERAVDYLMELGHTQIGILGGKTEISNAAAARFTGCQRAFARRGITFDVARQYESARFAMAGGYSAMGRLLDKMPHLTAVFAMSDVQAVGAIRAIRDRGLRVPEDISVIGFDGIELGQYFSPQLTTIQQDALGMADRGVDILLAHIEHPLPPVHERTPFRLIPGESARPLNP